MRFKPRFMFLNAAMLAASASMAGTQLSPIGDSIVLSNGSGEQNPDLNSTAKTKLVRLSNGGGTHGRLISVFGDAWGEGEAVGKQAAEGLLGREALSQGNTVYDVKAQAERPARDIYVRYSDDDGETWSDAVNISNTAAQSSISTYWQEGGEEAMEEPEPFYGDSDKPNIFNSGNMVVVSWVDKYCPDMGEPIMPPDMNYRPSSVQNTVTYVERDMREIPFSCVYTARSINGGQTWTTQQLSDGRRDAKQDVNKGSSKAWVVTWQEDPAGLQLGEGDGPGHGASGAKVSHGTDIWYSYVSTSYGEGQTVADSAFGQGMPFSTPVRITNNFSKMEDKRHDGNPVESGKAGSSRANTALVGGTVLVAYEETKGSEGLDEGKNIRYHSFAFNKSPATIENACLEEVNGDPADCDSPEQPPNPAIPERAGCILSKPDQNGRRVRFVPQSKAGSSGTKLFIFWKQGEYTSGGPSDIMGRYATDFTDLSTFVPALNVPTDGNLDGCLIRGEDDAVALGDQGATANTPAMNLSHDTPNGGDLSADSDDNPVENALAHRGYIRGNTIVLGYSYTPDGVLARSTDMEHHNFWIRRSLDGGATWTSATDMTSALMKAYIKENPKYTSITQLDIKEPRIVKTPGNGPATCPTGDPEDPSTTDKSECSNPKGFIVAVGLVENAYEHLGGGEELDLFITRSTDAGESYERPVVMAGTSAAEFESQIRMTPALDKVFAVWNSSDEEAGKNGHFLAFDVAEVDDENGAIKVEGKGGSTAPLMLTLLAGLGLLLRRRLA